MFSFLLIIPLWLMGQQVPELLPLVPGDPLELEQDLRERLIRDYSQENIEAFKAHTFPWFQVIGMIGLMSALPFALRGLKERKSPKSIQGPSLSSLWERIERIERAKSVDKNGVRELAQAFKLMFQPSLKIPVEHLTFQELEMKLLQQGMQSPQFDNLDFLQFQAQSPSKEQVKSVIKEIKTQLKRL
jgi:hypothetical protein